MNNRKTIYVAKLRNSARLINDLYLIAKDLTKQWDDEGYGAGDPIADGDLSDFNGITVADVKNFKKSLGQFLKFMDNQQPVVANYSKAANLIRSEENELRKFV